MLGEINDTISYQMFNPKLQKSKYVIINLFNNKKKLYQLRYQKTAA